MSKNTCPQILMQADVKDYVIVMSKIALPYSDEDTFLGAPPIFQPCSLPAIFPSIPLNTFLPTSQDILEETGWLWDDVMGVVDVFD